MHDLRLKDVADLYDPPPGAKLWHGGATVLGALRAVAPEAAAWIPGPGRHSIWALALHCAYWKYAVLRRVGEKRDGKGEGRFPRSPADWPSVPAERTASTWKNDRDLLREYHELLGAAIRAFDPGQLDASSGGKGKYSYSGLLHGIVLHDTYHAGQIQLLKRLYAAAP